MAPTAPLTTNYFLSMDKIEALVGLVGESATEIVF